MTDVPNLHQQGTRLGNWLTRNKAKKLLAVPDRSTIKGKRDYCILALLVGCALGVYDLNRPKIPGGQFLLVSNSNFPYSTLNMESY
jgi:hypothetical protein